MLDSNCIVYVLYYNEESKKKAIERFGKYKWARPFFNKSDKYLENNFYQRVMLFKDEWINKKFVGCISYKHPEKCPAQNIEKVFETYEDSDIDVVGLHSVSSRFTFAHMNHFHPGSFEMISQILKKINGPDINLVINKRPFYCNYWLCRPHILLKYIYYIDELVEKIEMDKNVSDILYSNSKYNATNAVKDVSRLYEIFGKPYYTWHCFFMERILPLFCYTNNLKIICL